jgi:hypothetical protein
LFADELICVIGDNDQASPLLDQGLQNFVGAFDNAARAVELTETVPEKGKKGVVLENSRIRLAHRNSDRNRAIASLHIVIGIVLNLDPLLKCRSYLKRYLATFRNSEWKRVR